MGARVEAKYLREEFEKKFGVARSIKAGDYIYISGLTSVNEQGETVGATDLRKQIEQVYMMMEKVLQQWGAGFQHVIKETWFATDLQEMMASNDVRLKFYEGVEVPPAVTAVEISALFKPELMFEAEAIVYMPDHNA